MRFLLIAAATLILTLAPGIRAWSSSEEDPWLQGQQRGYLMALCQIEEDGIMTLEQSEEYLRKYSKLERGLDAQYLEAVLRNYIGLKGCSFSRRVVYEAQPLLP